MDRLQRATLAVSIRRKLKKRPHDLTLNDIAAQAGLTPTWLIAFSRGRYAHPHEGHLLKLKAFFENLKVDA